MKGKGMKVSKEELRELLLQGNANYEIWDMLRERGYDKTQQNLYQRLNRLRKDLGMNLTVKERTARIDYIQNASDLLKSMTTFMDKLRKKYDGFDQEKIEQLGDEIEKGYAELGRTSGKEQRKLMRAELKFRLLKLDIMRGRESELEDKITAQYKNFVELLKVSFADKGDVNSGTFTQNIMNIAPAVRAEDEKIKELIRRQYPDTGPGNLG